MATLEGTVVAVSEFTTTEGPVKVASNLLIMNAKIAFTITGTYAQADDATLLAVPTVINSFTRRSDTIVLIDAAFSQAGDEAGTAIGASAVAVSGSDIDFQLTGSDMTTEHANAVLGTITRPITLFVAYTVAAV